MENQNKIKRIFTLQANEYDEVPSRIAVIYDDGSVEDFDVEAGTITPEEALEILRERFAELAEEHQISGSTREQIQKITDKNLYYSGIRGTEDGIEELLEEALAQAARVRKNNADISSTNDYSFGGDRPKRRLHRDNKYAGKIVKGALIVGGLAAVAAAGYGISNLVINGNPFGKEESKDANDTLENADSTSLEKKLENSNWPYYKTALSDPSQKELALNAGNLLEKFNGQIEKDGVVLGFTADEAWTLTAYADILNKQTEIKEGNLTDEELLQQYLMIYNGRKIDKEEFLNKDFGEAMNKYQYFLANDTKGNSGISTILKSDEADLLLKFESENAKYNAAKGDAAKTAQAKVIRNMYNRTFMDETTSDFVEYTTKNNVAANFLGDAHVNLLAIRTRGSSADMNGIADSFVMSNRACNAVVTQFIDEYNNYVDEFNNEYDAIREKQELNKESSFKFGSKKVVLTEEEQKIVKMHEQLEQITANPITIKNLMSSYYLQPKGNQNELVSTLNEGKLIPVRSGSSKSYSNSNYSSSSKGGSSSSGKSSTTEKEINDGSREEKRKEAIKQGATKEQLDEIDEKWEREAIAAEKNAQNEWAKREENGQNIFDDYFNAIRDGMSPSEARKEVGYDQMTDEEKNAFDAAVESGKDGADADKKDGETTGGKETDKGKDDYLEHKDDKEYNQDPLAPGAKDEGNNAANGGGNVVFDEVDENGNVITPDGGSTGNGGANNGGSEGNGNTSGGNVDNIYDEDDILPDTPSDDEEVFNPDDQDDINNANPKAYSTEEAVSTSVEISGEDLPVITDSEMSSNNEEALSAAIDAMINDMENQPAPQEEAVQYTK